MWWELDDQRAPKILFHFGMTGSFVIEGQDICKYKSFKVVCEHWPPKFTKLELTFEDGCRLAFCDPRRLARIRLCHGDPEKSDPICRLATDPLHNSLEISSTFKQINSKQCPIKSLLLDQEAIVCGIGNWVADEVLYQAGIHPCTPSNLLSIANVQKLIEVITIVLSTAVKLNADSENFPRNWMFHYRWEKKSDKESAPPQMPNGNWNISDRIANAKY